MKTDIETLKDTFQIGYEQFEASRIEADEVWDMYHNRQYTPDQLNVLNNRGQPAETFNVIKLFCRMLLGYYSTILNTVVVTPEKKSSIYTASLLNDLTAYTLRKNHFDTEGDKIKLSALISGLMVSYQIPVETGKRDRFGRPIRSTKVRYVPSSNVVIDPMSKAEDYNEDGRFIHVFQWMTEDVVISTYGEAAVEKLDAYYNHLDIDEAEFEYNYNGEFTGWYKIHNAYLIVHTVVEDDNGKRWSIHWSDEVELYKKEITTRDVKFPYRVVKLHTSDKAEYYGIFREVKETQKAINQALIKIQLMVNTQKVLVESGSVDDIDKFTDAYNRVTAVIEVNSIAGIKIENLSKDVLDQYTIIDKAFDRIQRILSINDSFLGIAFASDSGRKVKLQQNATITALRYITSRIEQFYLLLGWDLVNIFKQYYTAEQALRIVDDTVGERWIELNKPMEVFSGQVDPETGEPLMDFVYEEVLDPDNGKPLIDSRNNFIIAPIPEEETEIAFSDVDVNIETSAYNDEDEKNQLMMETVLAGGVGQMLASLNPAGYFKAYSLSIKTMKTKHSPDIAAILDQTAQMLGGSPEATEEAKTVAQNQTGGRSPKSETLKLPQNTNEGE